MDLYQNIKAVSNKTFSFNYTYGTMGLCRKSLMYCDVFSQ